MNFMSKNYCENNNTFSNGNTFKYRDNSSNSYNNYSNYSSAASSTYYNEDENSMNYDSEDGEYNNMVGQALNYCEATRGGMKKTFNNSEERQLFKQNYESKKKTELCRNFQMYGNCKYNNTCSYAHGEHQLQVKTHIPSNFMTKLCTQFHQDGTCQYGVRCQFLHSIYDLKSELTYTQALTEGARLTQKRNTQISGDTHADCLWANLKTGDGCGAPKKPRLACFEKIYNKDSLQENLRQIEQEDSLARAQAAPPAPIRYNNFQQPTLMKQISYNSSQGSTNGTPLKINFALHVQQPQLMNYNSFNQTKQMSWQPIQTFTKPFIAPPQNATNQKFESFFASKVQTACA